MFDTYNLIFGGVAWVVFEYGEYDYGVDGIFGLFCCAYCSIPFAEGGGVRVGIIIISGVIGECFEAHPSSGADCFGLVEVDSREVGIDVGW